MTDKITLSKLLQNLTDPANDDEAEKALAEKVLSRLFLNPSNLLQLNRVMVYKEADMLFTDKIPLRQPSTSIEVEVDCSILIRHTADFQDRKNRTSKLKPTPADIASFIVAIPSPVAAGNLTTYEPSIEVNVSWHPESDHTFKIKSVFATAGIVNKVEVADDLAQAKQLRAKAYQALDTKISEDESQARLANADSYYPTMGDAYITKRGEGKLFKHYNYSVFNIQTRPVSTAPPVYTGEAAKAQQFLTTIRQQVLAINNWWLATKKDISAFTAVLESNVLAPEVRVRQLQQAATKLAKNISKRSHPEAQSYFQAIANIPSVETASTQLSIIKSHYHTLEQKYSYSAGVVGAYNKAKYEEEHIDRSDVLTPLADKMEAQKEAGFRAQRHAVDYTDVSEIKTKKADIYKQFVEILSNDNLYEQLQLTAEDEQVATAWKQIIEKYRQQLARPAMINSLIMDESGSKGLVRRLDENGIPLSDANGQALYYKDIFVPTIEALEEMIRANASVGPDLKGRHAANDKAFVSLRFVLHTLNNLTPYGKSIDHQAIQRSLELVTENLNNIKESLASAAAEAASSAGRPKAG